MSITQDEFSELLDGDDSLYARLLTDISRGVFISGDRLVTTKLAERYGTSINPVREALKQLQGEGFVTSQPNSGARVKKVEYAAMRDVFELLQLLEPYLLKWFVEEHTSDQLDRVENIQARMEALDQDDFASYRELDTLFHWSMYRHHYNRSAVDLWKSKKLVLQAFHSGLEISEARFESSLAEHRQVLKHIKERDTDAVTATLNNHIKFSGDYWSRAFR